MMDIQVSTTKKALLFSASLLMAAFGQPVFSSWIGMLSAFIGYALIFRVIVSYDSMKWRFLIGCTWFTMVQVIQLSWLPSHPYAYIYFFWLLISLFMGAQFGIISVMITFRNIQRFSAILAIAAVWTLLEWSRLQPLSGFSFNPIGLSLAAHHYSLQTAALWGVYGLTFWVMFVNLLALRAWLNDWKTPLTISWALTAAAPYLFGAAHLAYHTSQLESPDRIQSEPYRVVLVQTAFPVEESMEFSDVREMISYTFEEWHKILDITAKQSGLQIDLIALPELVVPFGTYTTIFPLELVKAVFRNSLGKETLNKLPPLEPPFAKKIDEEWMVNNAYWAQGIANIFNAEVIIGLEDAEDIKPGEREFYSSAIHFRPSLFQPTRYEKRVLVPMGEYIPFAFCRDLAAGYGITGSFTCGREAKVIGGKVPFGVSICYEETFGHMMLENRQKGAEMLVNLTSDVWFPNSMLPRQHLEHARLRSVEAGIPLVRACNTGVTGVIDSLGRDVAELGKGDPNQEWIADSILVSVPRYHYNTLYSQVGDGLAVGFSALAALLFFRCRRIED